MDIIVGFEDLTNDFITNFEVNDESFSVQFDTSLIVSATEGFYYEFTQATAAAVWEVNHSLNRYPSVTVVDSSNSQLFCAVDYYSPTKIFLRFNSPTSGKAYLN